MGAEVGSFHLAEAIGKLTRGPCWTGGCLCIAWAVDSRALDGSDTVLTLLCTDSWGLELCFLDSFRLGPELTDSQRVVSPAPPEEAQLRRGLPCPDESLGSESCFPVGL